MNYFTAKEKSDQIITLISLMKTWGLGVNEMLGVTIELQKELNIMNTAEWEQKKEKFEGYNVELRG